METLEQTKTRLEAFTKESFPDADIAPGTVLSELLIKLAATLHNPIKNDVTALGTAQYISDVLAATADTYSTVIDKIASNYDVTRNAGRKVEGVIKVVVESKRLYFLPAGFTFVQANLGFSYTLTSKLEVLPYDTELGANQVKLFQEGGLYYFYVSVEAVDDTGKNNTQVTSGSKFTVGTGSTLSGFVYGEAYGNFSSGQAVETDIELIHRFREGLVNKSVVSPKSLLSVLRSEFSTLKYLSVIGANDPEMARSKKNAFGISTFGMADIYVRTSDSLETAKIAATAVVQPGDGTMWKIELNKSLDTGWPKGFYRVLSIAPNTTGSSGTYPITSITYGSETRALYRNNTINDADDARFSVYQTASILFEMPAGSPSGMLVTVLYSPLIEDIQDFVISDDNRVACADYLVKAIIPCEISLKLRIHKKYPMNIPAVPVDSIKKDIFTYINNLPLGEDIAVSRIIDICHNYDIKRVEMLEPMTGIIQAGSGYINISGRESLSIPTSYENGISKYTTAFFVNYLKEDGQSDNIGIQLI